MDHGKIIYGTYFQGHGSLRFESDNAALSGCMTKEEVKRRAEGAPCFDLENTSISVLIKDHKDAQERVKILREDPDTEEF